MRFKITIIILTLLLTSNIYAAEKNNVNKQPLEEMVKITLKQNPAILANRSNRLAAKAAIKKARGGFFPRVDSSFSTGRSNTKTTLSSVNTQTYLNPLATGVVVTQPIFSGLGTYNLVKQRKEEFKSLSFVEKAKEEEQSLQTTYAYFNVLRFQKMRAETIRNIRVHKEILKKVRMKYKRGAGPKADVDLAVGRLSRRIAYLHQIEGSLKNSEADFLEIVGIKPINLLVPKKPPNIPNDLSAALDVAFVNNPNYFVALTRHKAATKAVSVSKANLMPRVNIELKKNYSDDYSGSTYRSNDTRGMVTVNYNLFNGVSDINNIEQASYYRQSAMYNLRDTKNKIVERVASVWNSFKANEAGLIEHKKHLTASKKALDGYKKQFELGRRTLLDVLNMENEAFNVKINVINSKLNVMISRYELLANTGILARYFKQRIN